MGWICTLVGIYDECEANQFTSKFPDFSLTFYSWQIKKIILYFTLTVLNVSLQIWGLLFKERICSPWEQILSF